MTSLAVPCWTHLSPGREMRDFRDSVWSEGTVSVCFCFCQPCLLLVVFFLMLGLLVEEKFTCLTENLLRRLKPQRTGVKFHLPAWLPLKMFEFVPTLRRNPKAGRVGYRFMHRISRLGLHMCVFWVFVWLCLVYFPSKLSPRCHE